MDRESLKKYLGESYKGWNSFLNTVIFPIFGEENFISDDEDELLNKQPELLTLAEATGINSVKQIGTMDIGITRLYIFDITVSDRVMMERNRVSVQQLIHRAIEGSSCAFMIFHYTEETRWDWRFSFCRKSANNETATDSKRYTFLLGKGQSCRTAADNFIALYNKHQRNEEIEIDDIVNAFSVEALSKEFFEGYKKRYEDIIQHITGKRMMKVANKWEEKQVGEPNPDIMNEFSRFSDPEKAVRDYVKKLMGRLVFLQFLQKKGWLGVPVNKQWGSGDQKFIQKLFSKTEDKVHFVDNFLEPLFNDLNTERANDLVSPAVGSDIRVPYLNGGLFERDAADETQFPLPGEYMGSLLDFFSWYNFTIDENDPNDAEVGVDPEMLGRIFENLLEDNKDKGAFYTPKEIVSYMCRESLIAYLQTGIEDEATKEAIRQFVTTHDVNALGTNDRFRQQVDEALKNVKICDPAIGSGAFPMGLLKELFQCRTALEDIEQSEAAEIKKHIIQHNIYGVDIERGAVDIARLRFWLSLIVDEETPQALPNLDFKIMQGNSLLEQYKGVDLSKLLPEKVVDKQVGVQATFFDEEFGLEQIELQDLLNEYYNCTQHEKKKKMRRKISSTIQKQIHDRGINTDFSDLDLSGNNQFMLWHTWFYDVFSQGGFDIVIGNPPYIDSETMMKSMPDTRELYKNIFVTAKGNWDIYVIFFELGMALLNSQGILTYITPNKWISIGYGKALRDSYYENLHSLCDCQKIKVFEAGNEPVISLFLNKELDYINVSRFETNSNCCFIQSIPKQRIGKDNLGMCISENFTILANIIRQKNILGDFIDVENPFSTSEAYDLIELLKDEDSLKNYKLINTGTIDPYISLWGVKATSYLKGKYVYPTIGRIAFQEKFPKRVRQASSPKIIITGMRYFECYYDLDGSYIAGKSTIILLNPKEQSFFKVLLGILNSKLITFYIRGSFSTLGIGGGINFSRDMVENLPMPTLSQESQKIITFVDKILSAKRINLSADTSALEFEIDRLVYQLYGLTEEEIKIIEES